MDVLWFAVGYGNIPWHRYTMLFGRNTGYTLTWTRHGQTVVITGNGYEKS